MISYIILGMLSNGDGLTGYELKKYIENGIGIFYKASYGSLYPALKRLAKEGLVVLSEGFAGERKKKIYHITDSGSQAFHDWLTAPIDISGSASNQLAKVYFFDRLSPQIRVQLLTEYENNNQIYLRKLEALDRQYSQRGDLTQYYYKMSTLYYGIAVIRETLRWCRHVRDEKPLNELFMAGKGD